MKHKLWQILPLTMIMLFCGFGLLFSVKAQAWDGSTEASFASGSGTKSDPYVIKTADQLSYLAKNVNGANSYSGVYFVLGNDIVLNDENFVFDADTGLVRVSDGTNTAYLGTGIKGDSSKSNTVFDAVASELGTWYESDSSKIKGSYAGTLNTWTPIGNEKNRFEGYFDGKDHTVSGLYVNTTLDYGGLFGYAHATLENINVQSSYVRSGQYTGAVAGTNLGSTKRCAVNATVCSEKNNVGGVIGRGGSVLECLSDCIVNGAQNVGGIAGSARVEKSCNTKAVFGTVNVGGIVGTGNVLDCFNTASVWGYQSVGGVCGMINGQSISNSYNIGTVYGEKYVGSVLGRMVEGSITNCYYLLGCAIDFSNKTQNGLGAANTGSSRADSSGMTCGLDDDQIKQKESFDGFDFENVWTMPLSSGGTPALISLKAQTHTHKYSNAWSYDADSHWHACSCGDKQDLSDHKYDNACDTVCNDCAYVRIASHSYKTEWSADKTSHWHECSVCSHKKDLENHKAGAAATDTSPQICTVCSYVITQAIAHKHSYSNDWSSNDVEHWHECSCGDRDDVGKHKYDNDCDADCNDCGYERVAKHTYGADKKYDGKSHWIECSVCMDKEQSEIHVFDNLCDKTCNGCGYIREIAHVYDDKWLSDEGGHWHRCVLCQTDSEKTQHTFDDGTVTKQPTVYEEGIKTYKCSACSFIKTEPIAKLTSQGTDVSTATNATSDTTNTPTTTTAPQTSPNKTQGDKVNTAADDGNDKSDQSDVYPILTVVFGAASVILLATLIVVMIYFFKKKK